jgi:hypothetical protein
MLRDSESLNWSDIIAKVNANVEPLIVVHDEKIDKCGRVCNNRQKGGTAVPSSPAHISAISR